MRKETAQFSEKYHRKVDSFTTSQTVASLLEFLPCVSFHWTWKTHWFNFLYSPEQTAYGGFPQPQRRRGRRVHLQEILQRARVCAGHWTQRSSMSRQREETKERSETALQEWQVGPTAYWLCITCLILNSSMSQTFQGVKCENLKWCFLYFTSVSLSLWKHEKGFLTDVE